jgi:hypothetical protein
MIRTDSLALAATLALGISSIAQAQQNGLRLVGGGEDAQVVYTQPSHNLAGRGSATLVGGGEDHQVVYAPMSTGQASSGFVARITGGGENQQVVYEAAPNTNSALARLIGPSRT